MIIVTAILSIATFLVALHFFGVIRVGAGILPVSRLAMQTMQNPELDDSEKEQAMQQASLLLARAFGSILVRSVATLAVSFVPVAAADLLGVAKIDEVLMFLARGDVIAISTVIIVAGYLLGPRLWRSR